MGCCLIAAVLAGAPRLALLLWWVFDAGRVVGTFGAWERTIGSVTFPMWAWPLLGLVILPWTTIAYVFVAPAGVNTLEWAILVIALLVDLGAHGGSGESYRRRR